MSIWTHIACFAAGLILGVVGILVTILATGEDCDSTKNNDFDQ